MPDIDLKYGRTSFAFAYDDARFEVLGRTSSAAALTDAEIGQKLDSPIGSKPLEEIISSGETVLIVVPDATRQTACGQIANLVVRRLIANGTNAFDIRIIFATGIHRPVTDEEKAAILTPFIAQRIKTLDHDARDLMQIVRLGETDGGIPVELNRAAIEHDHVILVGGVSYHYFAGFTGGRKLVCPGLASSRTISSTHELAFDCETGSRRDGVDTGLLDGNAVHEAFVAVAGKASPAFAITTTVNDAGDAVDLHCGDWILSHRAACEAYARDHTIEIAEKRDMVIVSCGGSPHDINMIQAHKALEAASHACNDGGTIIFLAECGDGLGRDDFLKWFAADDSKALATRLCSGYQVNGQTAWSLLGKTERFDVHIITELDASVAERMRFNPAVSLDAAIEKAASRSSGFLIPNAAKFAIRLI